MGQVGADGNPSFLDVSRTVQSSDLFAPYREPRVTLPTTGSFQQDAPPFGGKHWGGPLSEYGGIGGLTFIGRQRVRDLEVSRSHRHYRSGFSKYLTDIQPYRLTELHLSECRLNDQILPLSLQADISSLNWQRENPWPGSQAYGTHRSIFEVFPTLNPERSLPKQESVHNSRSSNLQTLSEATKSALLDLNKKLYQKTLYVDSYRDYSRPNLSQPIPAMPEDGKGDSTAAEETIASEGTADEEAVDEDEEEEKDKYSSAEEIEEDTTTGLNGDLEKPSSNPDLMKKKSSKTVTFNDTPQIMEDTTRHFSVVPNKPMAGVGPCWPPGSSYVIDNINGARLIERADITQSQPVYHEAPKPTDDRKKQRLLSARARLANRFSDIISREQRARATPSLIACMKSQDAFLKRRLQKLHPANDDQNPCNQTQEEPSISANHLQGIASPNKTSESIQNEPVKLPAVQKIQKVDQPPFVVPSSFRKPSLVLPPAPLADCLSPAGTRTPHKLGLRYKSEAHKRYHLMYPDNIPDLRTNRKEGKKVFFLQLSFFCLQRIDYPLNSMKQQRAPYKS